MKLYYSKGACSLAVRIALHEIGISSEFEAVNLRTKQTETGEDFLKINPKGAVPTLLLDNQEVLTENAVIQQYLADHYQATKLLPPVGDLKRYRALEWLNFVTTELHKGCAPLFNPQLPAELKDSIFKPALKNKLNFVDQQLGHQKYLLGENFTLADGYLYVILFWLPNFKFELSEWGNLSRYFNELTARKAIQQALREEGLAN